MERLRELRKAHNNTQAEIAKYLDVDRTTYVKYETDASRPNIDFTIKLAKFFNVSIDYLLGISNDSTSPCNNTDTPTLLPIDDINNYANFLIKSISELSEDGRKQVENFMRFVAEQERKDAKTTETGDKCED